MDTKAFQEMQDRIRKESAARATGQPLPVQKTPDTIQPAQKVSTVESVKRVATAGLGAVGNVLSAPQKFVQSTITGGKGYEDFYTNNPIGKKIVSTAQNPIVNNAVPIVKTFSSPKAAAFTSELALDPLNLVGAGLLSEAGKVAKIPQLASKISAVASKIPAVQKVKDIAGAFKYGYGLQPKFLKQLETVKKGVSTAGEYAANVAKPLKYGPDGKELPKQIQTVLGDIMRMRSEGSNRALTQAEIKIIKKLQ